MQGYLWNDFADLFAECDIPLDVKLPQDGPEFKDLFKDVHGVDLFDYMSKKGK